MFYVYLISRPDGTPCYVGKGKGDRWRHHFHSAKNKHLTNVIKKYGREKLPVKRVDNLTEPEAYELEELLISVIGRSYDGGTLCNVSIGGYGSASGCVPWNKNGTHTPEAREKISRAHTGRKRSPESVAKTAAANRGMKRSEEAKKKMSLKSKGRKRSLEAIAAGRQKIIGRKHTAAELEKMSVALNAAHAADPTIRQRQSEARRAWWKKRKIENLNVR